MTQTYINLKKKGSIMGFGRDDDKKKVRFIVYKQS